MSPDISVLQLLTSAAFVSVFVLTVRDFARHRDRPHLEVAVLFGSVGLVAALQLAKGLTGTSWAWADWLGVLFLLAQPYLVLRLVQHFRNVPRLQRLIGFFCLTASWAIVIAAGMPLPGWAGVTIIVAFAYVEGYATLALVRACLTTRGFVQRRLVAAAIGCGLLATAIVLSGVEIALPVAPPGLQPAERLLALGSALAYYVGFAPPAWLRHSWQLSEVQYFLRGLAGRAASERLATAREHLGEAATRATGGKAAAVLLADAGGQRFQLDADPESRAAFSAAGISSLTLDARPHVLERAWVGQACIASREPEEWGADLRRFAAAVGGARGALVAPLTASGQRYGLVVVLVERGEIFQQDDLAVLAMLAEQAALAIEGQQLIDAVERERTTLAAIMGSMSDGVLVLDSDEQVRYCNTRAEEVLAVSPGALVSTSSEAAFAQIRPSLIDPEQARSSWQRVFGRPDERCSFEVGVASGRIVLGRIGPPERAELGVLGDPINVAARLVGRAGPGEVLLSASVHGALGGKVQAELLGSQMVRGRAGPVEMYRIPLLGRSQSSSLA